MSVSPFCELPMNAKKTVIVTYQTTTYDDDATIKIYANCDEVMRYLVNEIEEYEYKIPFKCEIDKNSKLTINLVSGYQNEPVKIIENAWIYYNNEKNKFVDKNEFFQFVFKNEKGDMDEINDESHFEIEVEFLEKFNVENLFQKINFSQIETNLFLNKKIKL